MIQSITFGDKNTWDNWKILPTERPVFSPPKQKNRYVDIPGGNGILDLSESLTGFPIFENRTGSFKFKVMNDYETWIQRYSEIMEYLHGKTYRAILYDDPNWFYEGRFSVDSWESEDTWSVITIGYNVGPYKWAINALEVLDSLVINSPSNWVDNILDGSNFGKAPIIPKLTISGSSSLSAKFVNEHLNINKTIDLTDGVYDISDFIFYGSNSYTISFKGVGTISMELRAGRL